jgi:large subunit ribosomal protein L32
MMRRANHDKLKAHNVIWCAKCGERRIAHRACPSCGDYNGRQALAIIER